MRGIFIKYYDDFIEIGQFLSMITMHGPELFPDPSTILICASAIC